jgi:hypothetical protein
MNIPKHEYNYLSSITEENLNIKENNLIKPVVAKEIRIKDKINTNKNENKNNTKVSKHYTHKSASSLVDNILKNYLK